MRDRACGHRLLERVGRQGRRTRSRARRLGCSGRRCTASVRRRWLGVRCALRRRITSNRTSSSATFPLVKASQAHYRCDWRVRGACFARAGVSSDFCPDQVGLARAHIFSPAANGCERGSLLYVQVSYDGGRCRRSQGRGDGSQQTRETRRRHENVQGLK